MTSFINNNIKLVVFLAVALLFFLIIGRRNADEGEINDSTQIPLELDTCRVDTIFVQNKVDSFIVRFGKTKLMDVDLNFYDSYPESVYPEAKNYQYAFYDTVFVPLYSSIEIEIGLRKPAIIEQLEIINQHYNTRETVRSSYKTTYRIKENHIIAHVVAPDVRRAMGNQRNLYLSFNIDECKYDIPIVLKLAHN